MHRRVCHLLTHFTFNCGQELRPLQLMCKVTWHVLGTMTSSPHVRVKGTSFSGTFYVCSSFFFPLMTRLRIFIVEVSQLKLSLTQGVRMYPVTQKQMAFNRVFLSFHFFFPSLCNLRSKYYEREALMHDSVFGPILAALLGECVALCSY